MATDRQKDVVRLRAKGMTQMAIAAELGIGQSTVSMLLRRAERRKRGERATTAIKRPRLNTAKQAKSILVPVVAETAIIELRRGTWERFKSPVLERLASEYEGLRGAVLRLPRGNTADDALAGCERDCPVRHRHVEGWARAYGRSDRMLTAIIAARNLLGLPPRGETRTNRPTAVFYCDDGSRRRVSIA